MAFYICSNCGFGSGSWLGKCPDCGEWNSMKRQNDAGEDAKTKGSSRKKLVEATALTPLSAVDSTKKDRLATKLFEFDRVLGGGFISGEVVLLTGEPGIGKSTLLLQCLKHMKVMYVSGEESAAQVADRAKRLHIPLDQILFSTETQTESIVETIKKEADSVDVVVIDSIQTVYSKDVSGMSGSVSQLKECAIQLVALAKSLHKPMVIVGHVTKEGDVAGPKTLEHLVDCVLLFEGDKISMHRVLRASKNRFGSTDEVGIFAMNETGLVEVTNPTAFIEDNESTPGRAIVGVAEGKRPLFFEIQTLAVPTTLPMPRRIVKGVDYNKVQLLLAVIRKHLHLQMDTHDIYVNVVGGIDIKSPAADLGIVASLISSFKNIALPAKSVFLGEVGLLGEVRPVFYQERIVEEAKRLSFGKTYSPANIKHVRDLLSQISK